MKTKHLFVIILASTLWGLPAALTSGGAEEPSRNGPAPGFVGEGQRPREGEFRPGGERQERREQERREMKQQLERLHGQLQELVANQRMDEAAEVKNQIAKLERRLSAQDRPGGERPERDVLQRREMEPLPPQVREARETERRLHHLMIAIENLRMGGFPEPADKLEPLATRLRRHLEELGQPRVEEFRREGPDRPGRDEMAAQLDELRQAVRQLQMQVEKLSR